MAWIGLFVREEEEGLCPGAAPLSGELRGWLWCDTGAAASFAGVDGICGCEGSGAARRSPWETVQVGVSWGGKRRKIQKKSGGEEKKKGEKWEKLKKWEK